MAAAGRSGIRVELRGKGAASVETGLPVFDRGQGANAVARATRAQLHADYAARLASAVGQVQAALDAAAIAAGITPGFLTTGVIAILTSSV